MKVSIISFTEQGRLLSEKIAEKLKEVKCALYTKGSFVSENDLQTEVVKCSISQWAGKQFQERNALLFIGACGIAVRAIAPYVSDKLSDSPVLVMDECGRYIIPVLSGHVGGANELAVCLAERTGAEPVITTATDRNKKFAVDLFAKKNGLFITNREGIAKISAKILSGQRITMSVENGHLENRENLPEEIELTEYPPVQKADVVITSENKTFQCTLLLKPREYGIGMGCRKGKEAEKIESFIRKSLESAGVALLQVYGLASIEVKKEETGFLTWSNTHNIPFVTYSAEELMKAEGNIHKSEFVEKQVGADNVCERAALKLCGSGSRLVYEKHAEDGMTIAVAARDWKVYFDEKEN